MLKNDFNDESIYNSETVASSLSVSQLIIWSF